MRDSMQPTRSPQSAAAHSWAWYSYALYNLGYFCAESPVTARAAGARVPVLVGFTCAQDTRASFWCTSMRVPTPTCPSSCFSCHSCADAGGLGKTSEKCATQCWQRLRCWQLHRFVLVRYYLMCFWAQITGIALPNPQTRRTSNSAVTAANAWHGPSLHGAGQKGYTCDPAACTGSCHCAGITSPGGLTPAETPQFVLITHDDAVTDLANNVVRGITDPHKNPNGCNVPATWFVTQSGSECEYIKKLYDENHELAIHTMHHARLAPGFNGLEEEMLGVKTWMNSECGIPSDAMQGFRSPFLVNNEPQRELLAKNGFLYDSSINEFVGEDSHFTKSFGQRLWPYTMDSGIPQNCNWTYPDGQCSKEERYPGMWEVPMWDLPSDAKNTEEKAYTMDYGAGFGGDLYTTLTTNFDQAYGGNRAPFPIFVHAPWFTASNTELTNKFIAYALSKPDVHFVTITQLLNWIKNPVPASQVGATLTCKAVDLTPKPAATCQKYTVKHGDFLDKIAGKYGLVDSTELAAINPGSLSLVPGQVLKIPPWTKACESSGAHVEVDIKAPAPDVAATPAVTAPSPAAVQPPEVVAAPTSTAASQPTTTAPAGPASSHVNPVAPAQYAAVPAVVAPVQPAPASLDLVSMGFQFEDASEADFQAAGQARFTVALAQTLGVPPEDITTSVVPARRRVLLQQSNLAVQADVVTGDPVGVYYKAEGEFE